MSNGCFCRLEDSRGLINVALVSVIFPQFRWLGFAAVCLPIATHLEAKTIIHPAPQGEPLCAEFTVTVQGRSVPAYEAKVAPAAPELRWKAMDDKTNSARYFEKASFCSVDADQDVEFEIHPAGPVRSARLLPTSCGLAPQIRGDRIVLRVPPPFPRQLTLELNGSWTNALHLFVNPPEKDIPTPNQPGVIYFGPGIHEVTSLLVTNNQTVYIDGAAVVRGVIGPAEPYSVSGYSGLKNYAPTFLLRGTNITFRGRGILDGGSSTTHARHLVQVQGADIRLEGVILRDSSTWTVPIRRSDRVRATNLKLIGYRANSDGIDICNSREVTVQHCFIRTLDDLIVIKSDRGQGKSERILAEKCVLWNEVAHAVSVGAELREDVHDVVFRDCDVIHDLGREWTLRVYHCDSARVSGIRFENLRIEESPRLASLWIGKAFWSRDAERGKIDGVVFKDLTASAKPLRIELKGFDANHAIDNVRFEGVLVNGRPLSTADVTINEFVRNVTVTP